MNEEYYAGELNPAIVKPSSTQNRYYNTLYQQLPDKLRTQISRVWSAAQNSNKAEEYEKDINRLIDIYELAGSPKIKENNSKYKFGQSRPNAWIGKINNINSLNDLISELAHPIQFKYTKTGGIWDGIKHFISIPFQPGKTLYDKQMSTYNKPWSMEYKTHSLVEPALNDYWNGTINSLDDLKNQLLKFKSGGIVKRVESGKSGIHIKPENRGKLTRLKKRTGKSEAELWKEGDPAVRKMITFARNSRKWKH